MIVKREQIILNFQVALEKLVVIGWELEVRSSQKMIFFEENTESDEIFGKHMKEYG